MLTGIIAPTEIEIKIVAGELQNSKRFDIHFKTFYSGSIKGDIPAIICISGIGKTNAAHGTTLLIEKFSPDIIYLTGIGGAYPSSGLNIGDIAIAEKEIYGDEGLALKNSFHTIEEMGLPVISIGKSDYFNEFELSVPERFKDYKNRGNFVTVSSCTGFLERAFALEKRFNAICENMEGAAVAHICKLYGTTLVEIRGISNLISDRKAVKLDKKEILTASESVQSFLIETIM